jgi:hypothetical protein
LQNRYDLAMTGAAIGSALGRIPQHRSKAA